MAQKSLLEIKYRKMFPIFFLVCSVLILYAALIAGFTSNTVIGLIFLPISILMLTRSVILVTCNTIQMKNLLGMTVKQHPYTPEQISIRNSSVFINDKKLFSTWWTDTNIRKVSAFLQPDS